MMHNFSRVTHCNTLLLTNQRQLCYEVHIQLHNRHPPSKVTNSVSVAICHNVLHTLTHTHLNHQQDSGPCSDFNVGDNFIYRLKRKKKRVAYLALYFNKMRHGKTEGGRRTMKKDMGPMGWDEERRRERSHRMKEFLQNILWPQQSRTNLCPYSLSSQVFWNNKVQTVPVYFSAYFNRTDSQYLSLAHSSPRMNLAVGLFEMHRPYFKARGYFTTGLRFIKPSQMSFWESFQTKLVADTISGAVLDMVLKCQKHLTVYQAKPKEKNIIKKTL